MTKIAMSGAEARPRARPAIFDIDPYVPGQSAAPGAADIFKLSANETPLGPSPRAREALRAFADRLQDYPDGAATALREALGARHGLDPARIVCGTRSGGTPPLPPPAHPRARDSGVFPQ